MAKTPLAALLSFLFVFMSEVDIDIDIVCGFTAGTFDNNEACDLAADTFGDRLCTV
ncbi:MAG: hypothetical protein LBN35_02050 [Clostridiales Family XIII bacterium]|jgi:hypothetical protein|nr:hypothetical protein [Clostridiales Family XIII bacterium]